MLVYKGASAGPHRYISVRKGRQEGRREGGVAAVCNHERSTAASLEAMSAVAASAACRLPISVWQLFAVNTD